MQEHVPLLVGRKPHSFGQTKLELPFGLPTRILLSFEVGTPTLKPQESDLVLKHLDILP